MTAGPTRVWTLSAFLKTLHEILSFKLIHPQNEDGGEGVPARGAPAVTERSKLN